MTKTRTKRVRPTLEPGTTTFYDYDISDESVVVIHKKCPIGWRVVTTTIDKAVQIALEHYDMHNPIVK